MLDKLRLQVNSSNYRTWLNNTHGLYCRGRVFMLAVPNPSVAEYLDTHLRSLIEKTLIGVTQSKYSIAFKAESEGCVA